MATNLDLTGSRIADATRNWLENEDVAVTSAYIDDDFVIATMLEANGNTTTNILLQWRDATDASGWNSLGSTGELTYNGVTDLVNGTACTSNEWGCTPIGGSTPIEGLEKEGGGSTGVWVYNTGEYTEHQWAVDFSTADSGHEYEFRLWDVGGSASPGTCLASITVFPLGPVIVSLEATATPAAGVSGALTVTEPIVAAPQIGLKRVFDVDDAKRVFAI